MRYEKSMTGLSHCGDEELLSYFSGGSVKAFDEIVKRYKDRVFNFLFKYTGSRDDCHDIIQESFITLYNYRERTGEIRKLSTWIFTISLNNARSRFRNSLRYEEFSEENINEEYLSRYHGDEFTENIEDFDSEGTQFEKLQEAFEKLEGACREAILLRYDEDMDYEKIAEILNVPVGTVKSRINRGRKQLKEIMTGRSN